MEEQVVINARIANRSYKIKVKPDHEGYVRSQLNQIADKLQQFKTNFPGMDEQDYMAMVLLEHITMSSTTTSDSNHTSIEQSLQHISTLLDQ